MSCKSLPRKLSLLDLPAELRTEIWTIFYTAVCPPRIIYHEDHYKGDNMTKKHLISFAIASSCKILHAEIWPLIWHHTELHLTRDICAWYHHELPPTWQRKKIRHVIWYMTVDSHGCEHMVPEDPLPLWEYPALESFKLCSAMWAEINEMPPDAESREPAFPFVDARAIRACRPEIPSAVKSYRHMCSAERIAQWRSVLWMDGESLIQRLLKFLDKDYDTDPQNDWLRRLICVNEFDIKVAAGMDDGAGSGQKDIDDDVFAVREKAMNLLGTIASKIQITVQIELVWSTERSHNNYGPYDESQDVGKLPVFCIVDATSRKIVEMRQPNLQEYKDRVALGMFTVWNWP